MYYFIYWMQNQETSELIQGIKLYSLIFFENLVICYFKNRGDLFKFRLMCFANNNIGVSLLLT